MSSPSPTVYGHALMGEMLIAQGDTEPKKLVTDGLISCISFAGWNPDTKTGFLTHFSHPKQVIQFYSEGIPLIQERTNVIDALFQCKITGGFTKAKYSHEMLKILKETLTSELAIDLEIVEETPPSDQPIAKNLSLDLTDGSFGEYNPSENLDHRSPSPADIARHLSLRSEELIFIVN